MNRVLTSLTVTGREGLEEQFSFKKVRKPKFLEGIDAAMYLVYMPSTSKRKKTYLTFGYLVEDAAEVWWAVTSDFKRLEEKAKPRLAGPFIDPGGRAKALEALLDANVYRPSVPQENPIEVLAIINPEDGLFSRAMYALMHGAEEGLEYAKEEPLKAFLYTAAFTAAGYGIYRMAVYPFPVFGGVLEMNGQRYRFTTADRLWMGRMVIGEAGQSGWDSPATLEAKKRAGAAVLWSVATRHMSIPVLFRSGSYTKTMRAFSQPINPIWESPTACRNGRGCCGSVTGSCSPRRLRRRLEIRTKPWLALPVEVRGLVDLFVAGRLANPIPGYNNFAARGSISSGSLSSSTLPPTTIGGNTFIRDPHAQPGEARVV